jgi:hypothetical protein
MSRSRAGRSRPQAGENEHQKQLPRRRPQRQVMQRLRALAHHCRRCRYIADHDGHCAARLFHCCCRAYMFFPSRDHRIFVQYLEDRTATEVGGALLSSNPPSTQHDHSLHRCHQPHRRQVWGAYNQPQQLDALLASLDQRGCRDAALYEALCVNYSRWRATCDV